MANDKLFQKRRALKRSELARKEQTRKAYDRVLLVVEGTKTEVLYFKEIKEKYELSSANFVIDKNSITSPIRLVDRAIEVFISCKTQDPYDKVFVIFDRDSHASYYEAIEKCRNFCKKYKNDNGECVFEAIYSYPCFEYWYLLHFEGTDAPFRATENKSIAEKCIDELKKYEPDYEKSSSGYFSKFLRQGQLHGAIAHSKRIFDNSENGNDNPSTNVHVVVEYLMNIKNNGQ